jgi:hypothetical protein
MGQVVGPCTLAELRERIAAGTIRAETRVRRGLDGRWRAAGELRGFDRVPRVARIVESAADRDNPYATPAAESRPPLITGGRLAIAGVVGVTFGIFFEVVIASRNDRREDVPTQSSNGPVASVPARLNVPASNLPATTPRQLAVSDRALLSAFAAKFPGAKVQDDGLDERGLRQYVLNFTRGANAVMRSRGGFVTQFAFNCVVTAPHERDVHSALEILVANFAPDWPWEEARPWFRHALQTVELHYPISAPAGSPFDVNVCHGGLHPDVRIVTFQHGNG